MVQALLEDGLKVYEEVYSATLSHLPSLSAPSQNP